MGRIHAGLFVVKSGDDATGITVHHDRCETGEGDPVVAQESFGQQLRRIRKSAGLTQQALAARSGVALRSIVDLESDRRDRPHEATLRAIADALDLRDAQRTIFLGGRPGERATRGDAWREALGLPAHELIGREDDLAALYAIARPDASRFLPRLITLFGPAGVGKSHLALQLAADLADDYRDGVYRVDLAGLPSEHDLPRALARAIGLSALTGLGHLDALGSAIGARQILIVLDRCEDLLDPVAELIVPLLRRCPALRFVVPSRAPLEVDGEAIRLVAPFDMPDPTSLSRFRQHPAVRLLAARAAAAIPQFVVSRENAGAIVSLCRQAGGLPLALGLLATQLTAPHTTPHITPHDPAHGTVRGEVALAELIAEAFRRLAPDDRARLRSLAPFVASWPHEAIATVSPSPNGHHADPLRALLLSGLLQAEIRQSAQCYRLHPAVRAHALDELCAAGGEGRARSAHLDWCLALAREAARVGSPRRPSPPKTALEQADHDLAHALIWALAHDRERGRHLARTLRQSLGARHGTETSWARLLHHLE